jgi:UPF0042 nucleotide-binding protein
VEGIQAEREKLTEVRGLSNLIVDTSNFSVHDLKRFVTEQFQAREGEAELCVSIVSFGYKYGLPSNADLVFDVRFLPNPYFDPALRPFSGEDSEISDFLSAFEETDELLQRLEGILRYLLPHYSNEGKKYLTIAIGCTGGRHRSVFVSRELQVSLGKAGYDCRLAHRDVRKET